MASVRTLGVTARVDGAGRVATATLPPLVARSSPAPGSTSGPASSVVAPTAASRWTSKRMPMPTSMTSVSETRKPPLIQRVATAPMIVAGTPHTTHVRTILVSR